MLNFHSSIVINSRTTIILSTLNENSLLITWPEQISELQHQAIIHCQQLLIANKNLYIVDTVASYNSLLICYQFIKTPTKSLINHITLILKTELNNELSHSKVGQQTKNNHQAKEVVIPVCYTEQYGWDLKHVASSTGLTINEVIEKHTNASYNAYALGFTPGFCYLAKTADALHLPRRSTPRTQIPRGAVAIAEQQTAVYPNQSPGGWHILGQTPMSMYTLKNDSFIPKINIGDTVRFKAIDQITFEKISKEYVDNYSRSKRVAK